MVQGGGWGCGGLVTRRADMTAGGDFFWRAGKGHEAWAILWGGVGLISVCLHRLSRYQVDSAG